MTTARIAPDLLPLAVDIATLIPYPDNAKRHDLDDLRRSLTKRGQYRPAVRQESTGYVCVGNGMLAAAVSLGWDRLAVVTQDLDDVEARKLVAYDNRAPELAGIDPDLLVALLRPLPSLEDTGYLDDDLATLIAATTVPDFRPAPDEEAQPRLDRRSTTTCPNCAHEFVVRG